MSKTIPASRCTSSVQGQLQHGKTHNRPELLHGGLPTWEPSSIARDHEQVPYMEYTETWLITTSNVRKKWREGLKNDKKDCMTAVKNYRTERN